LSQHRYSSPNRSEHSNESTSDLSVTRTIAGCWLVAWYVEATRDANLKFYILYFSLEYLEHPNPYEFPLNFPIGTTSWLTFFDLFFFSIISKHQALPRNPGKWVIGILKVQRVRLNTSTALPLGETSAI